MTVARGDTIPFLLNVTHDESGQAFVGWGDHAVMFTVKSDSSLDDSDAEISMTSAPGGGISLLSAGAYWEAQTDGLSGDSAYAYDIQLVNTSIGRVVTLVNGTLMILHDITKDS